MPGSGISAPSLWGSSKPRVCRFCRWWSWQAFYPPMATRFAWSLLDWMCFQTTFGNGVICPLFNGLNFELCLFISMLAGHKFVLAEMCRFYTFGYELNFQPTQLEAFIQASRNNHLDGMSWKFRISIQFWMYLCGLRNFRKLIAAGVYSVQTPLNKGLSIVQTP